MGVLVVGMLCAGCVESNSPESRAQRSACDADNGGLTLAEGFCATVVADTLGPTRHLAVAPNGDVYAALDKETKGSGIVALRDTNGDYTADRAEYFSTAAGSGLRLHNGYLYFGPHTAVWRYRRQSGELVPSGDKEVVVSGFAEQPTHDAKSITFDREGHLFVNVGAPSNACMEETRTKGSPGQDPCPQLKTRGGIWRFDADALGQTHPEDGTRYATGIRNVNALRWHDGVDNLYAVQHGRDQLHAFFPDLYTQKESAQLPAEEVFKVDRGDNFGWPYCYYDWMQDEKVLMPEYGGDGQTVGRCDQFEPPIQAFPGHWAPNGLLFYNGTQFPETYRGGAFIAWHGSWNRAPLPQQGYKVTYSPFKGTKPTGDYKVFANGFAGTDTLASAGDAEYRPTGLAVGPEGGLYVSDDAQGRIWRITYVGTDD
jgi:glucose/arabinose dehydrogenase